MGWTEIPAVGAAEAPVKGAVAVPAAVAAAAAEEAQPEPSLAGDAAGGASDDDMSESETKDEVGAGKIEEQEDLFMSGNEDNKDDEGTGGVNDTPSDTTE